MKSKVLAVDDRTIALAAKSLLAGKLIGLPTETVYGLAARGDDDASVGGIFKAKERPRNNPLILHVVDFVDVKEFFANDLDAVLRGRLDCLSSLWPGPLTVIGPRHHQVLDSVTAGGDTVAIRIPDHPVAIAVLRELNSLAGKAVPVAAPSANVSNYISPTTAAHVESGLGSAVELILDGGPCQVGLESTIVYLGSRSSPPKILRQGHYDSQTIEDCLGEPIIRPDILPTDENPIAAPGQLAKHYSPKTPLALVTPSTPMTTCETTLRIDFQPETEMPPSPNHWTFAPYGKLTTAANRLYDVLRKADSAGFARIEVTACTEDGIGLAIMDRLRRAASSRV